MIQVQKEEGRSTTWYGSIERELHKYKIELDAASSLKSTWKKHVKEKIGIKMDEEIRTKCGEMSKGRIVKEDEYKKKDYADWA